MAIIKVKRTCWVITCVCLWICCGPARLAAETPEILTEIDRSAVFVGETLRFRVLLNHCDASTRPQLDPDAPFEVRLLQKTMTNNTQIVSDGITEKRTVRKGPLYEYELAPQQVGQLSVPQVTITVDGETYRSEPRTLQVTDLQEQDLARLSIVAEPQRVYPTQSFTVRLTVALRALPEPAEDREPLSVLRRLPGLQIPWANDESLAAGIEPRVPWQRWLNDLVDAGGVGFAINDLQGRRDLFAELLQGDPFDVLRGRGRERMRDPRLPFHPPVKQTLGEDLQGRKVPYWEYSLERRFEANRVGTYRFGPVSLKGGLAARVNSRGELEAEQVYARAEPVEVVVVEPPQAGRPASYTGAIGQFSISAELTPREARVGDPMTLSLAVRGEGTLEGTLAPDLAQRPEIADSFKVYDATEETSEAMRRFVYGVRPRNEQVETFPAIEFAYFDADQEKYVTVLTEPLAIEVRPSVQLTQDQIAIANSAAGKQGALDLQVGGIFANVTDLNQLRDEAVRPDRWLGLLTSLAVAFLGIVLAKEIIQRRNRDPAQRRRRIAEKRAHLRLASVRKLAAQNEWRDMAEHCSAALIGLAADVANLPEVGCTSAEATKQLQAVQICPELVQKFEDLLAECEAIRFGGGQATDADLADRAESLADELVKELRQKKLVG